jgi:hypothetical protein
MVNEFNEFNYSKIKYKMIWSKLLKNCLNSDQNTRWNIEKVEEFMSKNKKRVE